MKLMPRFFYFLMLFFCFGTSFSQMLEGSIFDKKTRMPVQSATVYLDGTTISTITDENGYFKLNSKGNTNPDLVISFIGYITSRINNPFQYQKIKTYIEEDAIAIDEVFIGKGPFTRKSMMKVFREQFLGTSKAAKSCKILNEDDINVYYDTKTNILSATSRTPLKIINSYLGYEVNFDLVDFEIQYGFRTLETSNLKRCFFAGTTFFKDIAKPKKNDKKRREVFLGSSTHLMQTIASKTWKEEKFRLYVDRLPVNPEEYFSVSDTLGIKKIKVIKEATTRINDSTVTAFQVINSSKIQRVDVQQKKAYFNILYAGKKQSVVDFKAKEYFVDENGNYTPFYELAFGGYIGALKAGDMLPMDYFQTIKGTY